MSKYSEKMIYKLFKNKKLGGKITLMAPIHIKNKDMYLFACPEGPDDYNGAFYVFDPDTKKHYSFNILENMDAYGKAILTQVDIRGWDKDDSISHSGVQGMKWYHRYHQSYSTKPTRSGKIGQEHFNKSERGYDIRDFASDKKHYDFKEDSDSMATVKKTLAAAGISTAVSGALLAFQISSGIIFPYMNLSIAATGVLTWGMTANAIKAHHDINKEEKRRLTLEKDPKSGLLKKNKDMSDDEDMKAINITKGLNGLGSNRNCVACTMAYDLRKKGYDVQAKRLTSGLEDKDSDKCYKNVKRKVLVENTKKNRIKAYSENNEDIKRTIFDKLAKEPNGSHGDLSVWWALGGGHSVVYEIKDGKPIIRDCQSGDKYESESEIMGFLDSVSGADLVRLDNLQPNFKEIKEYVR